MTIHDGETIIHAGERLDDLQRGNLRILQRPDGFCFGMDSVLLAWFAAQYAGKGKAIDLGTGSGVLPLLICARTPIQHFDAVEIQADIADMASRTMRLNGMAERIHIHAMDLQEAPKNLGYGQYRLAVSNPPYGHSEGKMQNPMAARRIARHEGTADIAAVCKAAGALLQNGGHFALVFPAGRLLSLFDAMRAARIEPKHICMVHPNYGQPPNLVLLDGMKGARPHLHFLPPLYIRDGEGQETEQIRAIYREEGICR